jgi:molecular chaperone DnaK (HSP70)
LYFLIIQRQNFSLNIGVTKRFALLASLSGHYPKADLTLQDIQYVLFAGGSSFNPLLHSLCTKKLNDIPLSSHEPDKLVAEGAAVYSYFFKHITSR